MPAPSSFAAASAAAAANNSNTSAAAASKKKKPVAPTAANGSNGGAATGGNGAASTSSKQPAAAATKQPAAASSASAQAQQQQQQQQNFEAQQQFMSNLSASTQAMRDRLLFLFSSMIGLIVNVTSLNGKVFEGIFDTVHITSQEDGGDDSGGYEVVLRWARIKNARPSMPQRPMEIFTIKGKDIAEIFIADITFAAEKKEHFRDERFVTDTEISRREMVERELVPWQPDGDDTDDSLEGSGGLGNGNSTADVDLDALDSSDSSYKGWDQYKTNQQLYGVSSTYDENLYTTKLDRSSKFYQENERMAEQLAREIEGQASDNIHLRAERGQDVSDVSEEELYSSVIRDMNEGKYVPPHQRRLAEQAMQKKQQQQVASKQQQGKAAAAGAGAGTASAPAPAPAATAAADGDKNKQQQQQQKQISSVQAQDMPRRSSTAGAAATAPSAASTSDAAALDQFKQQIPPSPVSATAARQAAAAPASRLSPSLSPLIAPKSPIVKPPVIKDALNLDTNPPKIPEEQLIEFNRFKTSVEAERKAQEKEVLLKSLKESKLELDKKIPKPSSPTHAGALAGAANLSRGRADSSAGVAAPTTAAAPSAAAEAAKPASTASSLKAKLNPNAKSFVFNPNAASFTPGGGASTSAAAATPAASAPASQAPSSSRPSMTGAPTPSGSGPMGTSGNRNAAPEDPALWGSIELRIVPLHESISGHIVKLIETRYKNNTLDEPSQVSSEWAIKPRKPQYGKGGQQGQGGGMHQQHPSQQQQQQQQAMEHMGAAGAPMMAYGPHGMPHPYAMEMQFAFGMPPYPGQHPHPHHMAPPAGMFPPDAAAAGFVAVPPPHAYGPAYGMPGPHPQDPNAYHHHQQ